MMRSVNKSCTNDKSPLCLCSLGTHTQINPLRSSSNLRVMLLLQSKLRELTSARGKNNLFINGNPLQAKILAFIIIIRIIFMFRKFFAHIMLTGCSGAYIIPILQDQYQ